MEKILNNKFMIGLQKLGEKLSENRYLSAISNGLSATIAIMMVGAIFQIIAAIPFLASIKPILLIPYEMTMDVISIYAAFTMAYVLASSFKMKAMPCGLMSVVLFLMVASPLETVVLESGETISILNAEALGAVGLFTAIFIALLSVRITKFFQDKNLTLKMGEVIPQFLSDSFASIIPLVANVVLFHGLNTIIEMTAGTTLPMAMMNLLRIPLATLTSTGGIFLLLFITLVLWVFGIHGSMLLMSVILPSYMQAVSMNADLVAAGSGAVFAPVLIAFVSIGGTGNTLPAVLLGLRSKSEQIRAVSKAALVPGLCNINEPFTFGMPIVYNPVLAIPYVFGTLIIYGIYYLGQVAGILKAPYILAFSILPVGVMDFMSTLSWTNLLFPYLMIPVGMLIWYPFMKVYENQLVKKETEAKLQAAGTKAE